MKTPYNILGVRRNASDEAIRAAFRRTAKACHPDLNPGDRTAQQRLMQVIAAYRILKGPQQRSAYDQYLRKCQHARTRRFAVDGVAALVGAGIASLAVWLWVSPSTTREASEPRQAPHLAAAMGSESVNRQVARPGDTSVHQNEDGGRRSEWSALNRRLSADSPQESASSLQPAAGSPGPPTLLAKEWEQVQGSADLRAIWAFTVRNPDAPESVLAQSKLVALIDTEEDVSLLNILRLAATDAIAERAQQRLIDLGPLAVAREDSVAPGAPSSNPLQASLGETIKLLIGAQRQDSVAPGAPLSNPPLQASLVETIKPVIGEQREDSAAPGAPSSNPPLQVSVSETIKPVIGEQQEDSVAPGAPSSSSPLQASLGETIKPVIGEQREDSVAPGAPSSNPAPQASLGDTIKLLTGAQPAPTLHRESPTPTGKREPPAAQKTAGQPRMVVKRQTTKPAPVEQVSSENRSRSVCAGFDSCSGHLTPPLFGVGF